MNTIKKQLEMMSLKRHLKNAAKELKESLNGTRKLQTWDEFLNDCQRETEINKRRKAARKRALHGFKSIFKNRNHKGLHKTY